MRLVTYLDGAVERVGAVHNHLVIDLSDIAPDMLALIAAGPQALEAARARVAAADGGTPLDSVTLLAPIPRPRQNIICLGMNYAAHAIESMRAKGLPEVLPEYPVFFTKSPSAINHPGASIPLLPEISSKRDWEVELAFIIGGAAHNVAPADALGAIFGYTILNDVSARDLQNKHQQFFFSKSLEGSAPMGPWIVTADEIPDPHALGLRLRLNGQTMQESSTGDMIFDIPTIIATLSKGMTLAPGDIIATGTPSGVGMGMTPQLWLKSGDVMEAEVDGIGVLRNTVV
ncbi:fumarylacetoacetate hydrolase family protein [Oscillochloris sp. ZM17-4]|uniref:fumarylacetoacetate hydrolase family protein n=1 Tax=Oscillochloris sp. ZM17-4 TaxID=2866714 RepID=UPI001C737C34|nr:fumarylacetoacetate hydrolase family protein [Oscillochloris sp. ZM17-4]MBX0327640.1 fumarylacetoacetate hydrolase family protein [Oscillochloris sp. ZM17-4]